MTQWFKGIRRQILDGRIRYAEEFGYILYLSTQDPRAGESLKLDGCGEFGAELDGCGRFVGRARQMRRGFGHLGGEKGCSGYRAGEKPRRGWCVELQGAVCRIAVREVVEGGEVEGGSGLRKRLVGRIDEGSVWIRRRIACGCVGSVLSGSNGSLGFQISCLFKIHRQLECIGFQVCLGPLQFQKNSSGVAILYFCISTLLTP